MNKTLTLASFLVACGLSANVKAVSVCDTQSNENPTALTITYDTNSTQIRNDSIEILKKVAADLRSAGRHIVVEGHSGDDEIDNRSLSASRASRVVKILQEELDYPRQLISAAGYADGKPGRIEIKVDCRQ